MVCILGYGMFKLVRLQIESQCECLIGYYRLVCYGDDLDDWQSFDIGNPTEEHAMLRDMIRDFVRNVIHVRMWNDQGEISFETNPMGGTTFKVYLRH